MKPDKLEIAIEALTERKEELLLEVKNLETSIKTLRGAINLEKVSVLKKEIPKTNSNYDPNWGLKRKFVFLLKKHNRFLHFREAANMIGELEGKTDGFGKLASTMSSATKAIKSNGTIVKYMANKSNRSTFWGYKDWLDTKGEVIEEHKYNEEYLYNPNEGKEGLFGEF